MKLVTLTFFTYVRSILLYLLFTLPAAAMPKIYVLSVVAAMVLGFIAWLCFTGFSLVVRLLKAKAVMVGVLLHAAVVMAVLVAYSVLLQYAVSSMHFWDIEPFSLFPTAAIAAGWISLFLNRKKLQQYFIATAPVKQQGYSLRPVKFYAN